MDIKLLALILLTERLVAVGFSLATLVMQWPLFKIKDQPELVSIRRILFFLVSVITLGQIIPIIVDSMALFINTGTPNPLGVAYAFSNATTADVAAIALWITYRIAERYTRGVRK